MKARSSIRAALPEELFAMLHIRSMQLDDLSQVLAIDSQSFTLPWPESAYRYELLENPSSFLMVAEIEQSEVGRLIVGVVVVWMILDEAHIATIAVHPEFRGQGIASRLMVSMMREAIQLEARLATLEVREQNTAAQRLYQRFGFNIVGRRPRYYKDNLDDALIMTVGCLDKGYLERLDQDDWANNSTGLAGSDPIAAASA
jgi:ribosomal-protein-alanine N-acetyltransferase